MQSASEVARMLTLTFGNVSTKWRCGPQSLKDKPVVRAQLDFEFPVVQKSPRRAIQSGINRGREAAVGRLREFLRFNYMTGTQLTRQIGVTDTTLYSWLQGNSKPRSGERIIAFLDSIPAERAGHHADRLPVSRIENWRGIAKPRRCSFFAA